MFPIDRFFAVLIRTKPILPFMFLMLMLCGSVFASEKEQPGNTIATLTNQEKAWIHGNPVIRVASTPDWPPFEFEENGDYKGLHADILRLAAAKSGLRIAPVFDKWAVLDKKLQNGELDLCPGLNASVERKKYLVFTDPVSETSQIIITKDTKRVSSISDLYGKTIAVEKGFANESYIKKNFPQIYLVVVNNTLDALKAVITDKADAYIGTQAVSLYIIKKHRFIGLKSSAFFEEALPSRYRIGVINSKPLLRDILQKGLDAISEYEMERLQEKWFGQDKVTPKIKLTRDEKDWIAKHPVIRVASDSAWAPLEYADKDGIFKGISIDYLRNIEKKLGIKFDRVQGKPWSQHIDMAKKRDVDIFSCVAETRELNEYLTFSSPYTTSSVVIFGQMDMPFIGDLSKLVGRKVAVVNGYATHEILNRDHPGITLVQVSNIHEALDLLNSGDVYAYVGNLLVTSYNISEHGYNRIKVVGETPYKLSLGMASRNDWPVFSNILEKALKSISEAEKNAIYRKWIAVKYEHGYDYSLIWKITASACLMFIVLFLWNRRLKLQVQKKTAALSLNEERLKAIFNHRFQLTGLLAPDGKMLMVNETARKVVGWDTKDLRGKYFWDLPFWAHSKELQLQVRDAVHSAQKGNAINFETTHADSKGDMRFIDFFMTPVRNKKGEIVYIVPEGHDISERKNSEKERITLERQLTQAQKLEAIGTLAGGIAHDFNNILSAILGYSELAMHELKKDDPVMHSFNQILKAGLRAKDLVKQILLFSRQSDQEMKPTKIAPLAKEAIKLLRATLPSTIEIKTNLSSTSDFVLANPIQIHQIFMNLCINSVQAMGENGGVLSIKFDSIELERDSFLTISDLIPGSYLKIQISDTGIGIPSNIIEKIFDPFFTTKDRGEGTGLGLAVVHGLVKSYNGTIKVSSEPDRGTTFDVYLPLCDTDEKSAISSAKSMPGGNERILLVDDEAPLLDIGKKMIEQLGYTVTTCTDGHSAWQMFQKDPDRFDMIITDKAMPQMTGLELARKISSLRPRLPIIMCTGFSEGITQESINAVGISALLYKPILKERIAMTIRKIFDEAR